MESNYVLLVESGKLRREIQVDETPIVLGRGPTANVRLPDDYCSREHAKFFAREGAIFVEDIGPVQL